MIDVLISFDHYRNIVPGDTVVGSMVLQLSAANQAGLGLDWITIQSPRHSHNNTAHNSIEIRSKTLPWLTS